jgi:hypothetical protein
MPRATVKLSGRSIMAAVAKQRNIVNGTITTGGSANAQTFTTTMSYLTVPTGMVIRAKVGFTNTGSATLNLDAIAAVTIKNQRGDNLAPGELLAGTYATFLYNGTNWILLDGNCGVSPMALINKQTVSGVSSLAYTGLTTDYSYYKLVFSNAHTNSAGGEIGLQASTNNGVSYDTGNNYQYSFVIQYQFTVSPSLVGASTITSAINLCPPVDTSNSAYAATGEFCLFNLGNGGLTFNVQGISQHYHLTTYGQMVLTIGGAYTAAAGANAFQLIPTIAGTTFSGNFSLYGIR